MNSYEKRIDRSNLFSMIVQLYNKGKYDTFIKKADKFLELYPDDITVYYMKGKAFRELGFFEDAIKCFELVYKSDNRTNALVELFYLYYFVGKYNKAIELLPIVEERHGIPLKKLRTIKLVLKHKLGFMTLQDNFELSDYQDYQIVDYEYGETLKHIRKHTDENNNYKSQFTKGINLDYLLSIIKKNLKVENRYNMKSSLDIYYFGMSGIGFDIYGCISNYVKVVVVPGTKDIISVYPIDSVNVDVVNIDYNREKMFSKEDKKIKSLSQIEKFNKKYGKSFK